MIVHELCARGPDRRRLRQEDRMPKTDVVVQLTGTDGNVFMLAGTVAAALKRAGPMRRQKPCSRNCLIARVTTRRCDCSCVSSRSSSSCLLYTSDAADDLLCVDLGGRRIIKKKKTTKKTD